MAASKRKRTDDKKGSTPAKKQKVDPKQAKKKEPAKPVKKAAATKPTTSKTVTSTKAKKAVPVKKSVTPKAAPKKVEKSKTPVKKEAKVETKAQNKKKVTPTILKVAKPITKPVTRGKIVKVIAEKAKPTKTQVTASKSKLKALKSLTKIKPKEAPKPAVKSEKKPVTTTPAKKDNKKTDTSKKSPENEQLDKKRKISTEVDVDAPRKRRIITPNKKYADFETDTSPKRISELRAYLQDKKNSPKPLKEKDTEEVEEEKKTPKRVSMPTAKKAASVKKTESSESLKVFKPSDMKPAEKLMKKLQNKLEKEAKAAVAGRPKQDKEKVTAKITKVVTYNKTNSPIKAMSPQMKLAALARKKKLKELPKSITTGTKQQSSKPKATPTAKPTKTGTSTLKQNASKPSKATPKVAQTPEKNGKPRKIKELKPEDRPVKAVFAFRKNIKLADDKNDKCWITGIDVFPSGDVILVDMAQKKIKLFSSTFESLSQVKLDTIPQDISISPVDASSAFFTKPFVKEGIQKVSMSDGKLTLKESFWTNGTNRGIKCTKAGILTSVQDGRYHDLDINCFKMDLLDYEGNCLQSVSADLSGSRLFKLPLYFDVSNNGKQMIVSDCIRKHSYVVSLDMSGKIKFKYTGSNNNLITPRGLTVDHENNIYVTEWEHHNVYMLSPTGKRMQILIDDEELIKDGLDGLKKPYQLCYRKNGEDGQLIVSQETCNSLKVFHVVKNVKDESKSAEATDAKPVETDAKTESDKSPTKAAKSPVKAVKPVVKAQKSSTRAKVDKKETQSKSKTEESKPTSPIKDSNEKEVEKNEIIDTESKTDNSKTVETKDVSDNDETDKTNESETAEKIVETMETDQTMETIETGVDRTAEQTVEAIETDLDHTDEQTVETDNNPTGDQTVETIEHDLEAPRLAEDPILEPEYEANEENEALESEVANITPDFDQAVENVETAQESIIETVGTITEVDNTQTEIIPEIQTEIIPEIQTEIIHEEQTTEPIVEEIEAQVLQMDTAEVELPNTDVMETNMEVLETNMEVLETGHIATEMEPVAIETEQAFLEMTESVEVMIATPEVNGVSLTPETPALVEENIIMEPEMYNVEPETSQNDINENPESNGKAASGNTIITESVQEMEDMPTLTLSSVDIPTGVSS